MGCLSSQPSWQLPVTPSPTLNQPHTVITEPHLAPQNSSHALAASPQISSNQAQPTKTNPNHPAPSRSASDIAQWQQVKRPRTRKPPAQPHTPTSASQASIQKSSSRTRKPKATNKFAVLDYVIHPTFTDDEIAPIEVALPTKPMKPPRRTFKDTRKALTKQVSDALNHHQEVRHPAHTLNHLSPLQTQVILRTKDKAARAGKERLIRQIALLRAARTNTSHRNILLDHQPDDLFINQVQVRLTDCTEPIDCSADTPIDLPLSTILDRDELRVRGAICYAWVDLASRALLPHLYDIWPDPPTWNGIPLRWLPASDEDVPCLHDESLAALAACPTLTRVWQHIAAPTPELASAIRTTANQWHLFTASQQKQ